MKQIIIISLLVLFSFFFSSDFALTAECNSSADCPKGLACGKQGECVRPLEVVYPIIPGEPTVISIDSGLPEYIKYIFNFAVVVSGLILFGILIYQGSRYVTSAGATDKLSDAKKGMWSGFLGVLVLFGAVLIFNTINPKLTALEPADITVIEPKIPAGIYFCNKQVSGIQSILEDYTTTGEADREKRIEAVKKFKTEIIGKPTDIKCFQARTTESLSKKQLLKAGEFYTLFVVPEENPRLSPPWEYNYGIVFHEKDSVRKDNFSGKCEVFFPEGLNDAVKDIKLDFKARAITPFAKSKISKGTNGEVTLYEGLNFNKLIPPDKKIEELGLKTETLPWPEVISKPEINFTGRNFETAGSISTPMYRDIRSYKIEPKEYYSVIFKGAGGNECAVRTKLYSNLMVFPIGRCEKGANEYCRFWFFQAETEADVLQECEPCIESMQIIRGMPM